MTATMAPRRGKAKTGKASVLVVPNDLQRRMAWQGNAVAGQHRACDTTALAAEKAGVSIAVANVLVGKSAAKPVNVWDAVKFVSFIGLDAAEWLAVGDQNSRELALDFYTRRAETSAKLLRTSPDA